MKSALVTFFVISFGFSAMASVKAVKIDGCAANLASAAIDAEQVVQLIRDKQKVRVQILRENFGMNHLNETIESRLRQQHQSNVLRLENEVAAAYDEAHNASITRKEPIEKLNRYRELEAKLIQYKAQFENTLQDLIHTEIKQGSYESHVAGLKPDIKVLELEGVITGDSKALMQIYDKTKGEFLDKSILVVDALMIRLTNGQTAYVPAVDVLSLSPN